MESEWTLSGRSFFASQILSIIILCIAKCSVVALIFRIFTVQIDRTWLLCVGAFVLNSVWGLGSIISLVVECDANTILTIKEVTTCPNQYARWQAITAIDIITELCTCALPLTFVWSTNLSRYLRFQVVLAFAFRLPLACLSAVHLELFAAYLPSSQPQFAISRSFVLQQVTLTYSLLSATIPNLKSFMRSFSVGLGVSIGFVHNGGLDDSNDAYYQMHSLEPCSHVFTGNRSQGWRSNYVELTRAIDMGEGSEAHELRSIFRPDQVTHRVTIKGSTYDQSAGPAASLENVRAVSRSGSQDMIIKK